MSTPEIIYLIKGEDDSDGEEIGMIWSDDPAPDSYSDPEEAVVYVRADEVERLEMLVESCSLRNSTDVDRIEALECMLRVFRGCIDTQILPTQGSPCHKMVWELMGAPDQSGDKE